MSERFQCFSYSVHDNSEDASVSLNGKVKLFLLYFLLFKCSFYYLMRTYIAFIPELSVTLQ